MSLVFLSFSFINITEKPRWGWRSQEQHSPGGKCQVNRNSCTEGLSLLIKVCLKSGNIVPYTYLSQNSAGGRGNAIEWLPRLNFGELSLLPSDSRGLSTNVKSTSMMVAVRCIESCLSMHKEKANQEAMFFYDHCFSFCHLAPPLVPALPTKCDPQVQ